MDKAVRDLILELKDEVSEPFLVVVTADHGEEFWEHVIIESKYFYHPHGAAGISHDNNLRSLIVIG